LVVIYKYTTMHGYMNVKSSWWTSWIVIIYCYHNTAAIHCCRFVLRLVFVVDRNYVVSIATVYGLDSPGIES